MSYEFSKGTNRYAIKTSMDKPNSDEIAISFKNIEAVKKFFSPAIEKMMPRETLLFLATRSAPLHCCRPKAKNDRTLSNQDCLDLFYTRVTKGELRVVQKDRHIKYSADPIGWFDWDEFFADPRVQPNFHELPASVQIATIKAWQKEKAPLTIVDIFRPTEFKSRRNPKGTIGIGFSASAGTGKAGSGTILVVFDEVGNVGYLKSGGFGGMGGSSVSGTFLIQVTNAKDIYKLKGLSVQTGGSVGEGLSVGLEYVNGAGYHGVNFSFGLGTGLTPAELHSIAEYASVNGAKVDDIINYVKELKSQN